MAGELRKSILEADDIPSEIVSVPEWGDIKILLKGMSGRERANFLKRASDADGNISFDKFYPELLIATAYDPSDESKVFEPADRDTLNSKSGAALERIAQVSQRLSGLGAVDAEAAKGNSPSSQSNAST